MSPMFSRISSLIILTVIVFATGFVRAEEAPRLSAPGGGELDINLQVTKCYGSKVKKAEAHWNQWGLETDYLEYNEKQGTVLGRGRVKVTEDAVVSRFLTCDEVIVDLQKETAEAKAVFFRYDDETQLQGTTAVWDRGNEVFRVEGNLPASGGKQSEPAMLVYNHWTITGSVITYRMPQGLLSISGPVKGSDGEASFTAGKLVFNRGEQRIYLEDRPVLKKGKNVITAAGIVYDLNTKKVLLQNETEFKSLDEDQ